LSSPALSHFNAIFLFSGQRADWQANHRAAGPANFSLNYECSALLKIRSDGWGQSLDCCQLPTFLVWAVLKRKLRPADWRSLLWI